MKSKLIKHSQDLESDGSVWLLQEKDLFLGAAEESLRGWGVLEGREESSCFWDAAAAAAVVGGSLDEEVERLALRTAEADEAAIGELIAKGCRYIWNRIWGCNDNWGVVVRRWCDSVWVYIVGECCLISFKYENMCGDFMDGDGVTRWR